jgi:Ca2+-binding EF-hand superfamily protein
VRSRLENIDPAYRQMNQVYYKMVQQLKQRKISIISAFEQFDLNGDGNLDRTEFYKALDMMGLGSLTNHEFEIVLGGLDMDNNGKVSYKEFNRKLQACGYRRMSKQEELIMHIINKLRKLQMSKAELFDLINKDGEGLITRKDFKDIITTLEMSHVSKEDIDSFCDYFYQDQKGGIDLKSFLNIFDRYERKFEGEEDPATGKKKPKRARNTPKVIEMKQKLFKQIDFAMSKHGTTLKRLFQSIDKNNSQFIG